MEILWWIEDSKIGMLVSSSEWGYPIVLSLHAVGMAVLVGVSLMITLRVLGLASAVPVTPMEPYWNYGIGGFIVNLISGVALAVREWYLIKKAHINLFDYRIGSHRVCVCCSLGGSSRDRLLPNILGNNGRKPWK